MKHEVTYACGHTGTVQIFGSASERQKKLDWYQTSAVCPDCYRAQNEAENAKEEAPEASADVAETVNNAVAEAISSNNPVYCKVIAAGYTWRISLRVKDDRSASLNGDFGTIGENTVFRFFEESPPDTNGSQDFAYCQWLEEKDHHSDYVAAGTIDLSGLSIGEAVARLLSHTPDYLSTLDKPSAE